MGVDLFGDGRRLESARRVLAYLGKSLDAPFSVRLWDGSMVALGRNVEPNSFISINHPDVISTILRHPSLETLVRLYALGRIDIHADDFMAFLDVLRQKESKKQLRSLKKLPLLREALIFLLSPSEKIKTEHSFNQGEKGLHGSQRNNRDYIQFHYDLSNDFYALFLDPQMQYSCAYFNDRHHSLEQAQQDKLEIICRKLCLKAGEKLLDIGSGWGGLICYAAQHYGVKAHGVTLSDEQYRYTLEKIKQEGLESLVTVDLKDYTQVEGCYDKIASIGMFEHIGLANIPVYFSKINSLLRDRGILLNHAITRRAKGSKKKFYKTVASMRLSQKFIFPGAALDHIGHSIESMELQGFEVRDVESWREHYALTTAEWCRRLIARRDEGIRYVGLERYRLWVGYLGAVSLGFVDGSLNICQTVAVKRSSKGLLGLPMTRKDWYP